LQSRAAYGEKIGQATFSALGINNLSCVEGKAPHLAQLCRAVLHTVQQGQRKLHHFLAAAQHLWSVELLAAAQHLWSVELQR
jgi:hypothetical protein